MKAKFSIINFIGITLLLASIWVERTDATLIDFEKRGLKHGRIVKNQYKTSHGVKIRAINGEKDPGDSRPDLSIIFDSRKRRTEDRDLEGPKRKRDGSIAGSWARGNLAPDTILGNLLIIAENDTDVVNNRTGASGSDRLIDRPDDEGSRPAGSIFLKFDKLVKSFGFDLIDIEETGGSVDFFEDRTRLASVQFSSFVDPGSPFFDPSVVFGDNSANRIKHITAAKLAHVVGNPNLTGFNRVKIRMAGSGAIDNIDYATPEPSTFVLFGIGVLGFLVYGHRRRKQGATQDDSTQSSAE